MLALVVLFILILATMLVVIVTQELIRQWAGRLRRAPRVNNQRTATTIDMPVQARPPGEQHAEHPSHNGAVSVYGATRHRTYRQSPLSTNAAQ